MLLASITIPLSIHTLINLLVNSVESNFRKANNIRGINETFGLLKNHLTKTEVKGYIYWNVFSLITECILSIIFDKKMNEKLIFVYGRVLRPNLYARNRRGDTKNLALIKNVLMERLDLQYP